MMLNQHKKSIIISYLLVRKVNQLGNLMNRIPGSRLLISSLPGSALRTHVESLGKPCDVNKHFKALPGRLDIRDTHLVFSIILPWVGPV